MLTFLLVSFLTLVELNCENLFDCSHDSLKQDIEFTPDGSRYWTRTRFWAKLNHIGQDILSCSKELPDIVALCEIENDSVAHYLTRRSLLRNAGYEYLMTESPDVRGIDVALLYQPSRFRPLCYDVIDVEPISGMRPTRQILHVEGITQALDTIHLFIVHAPSRYGGEQTSRPFRMHVTQKLLEAIKRIDKGNVIVAGDFNDYAESPSLQLLERHGLVNVSKSAKGLYGKAHGTYRYKGEWHSIDHILLTSRMAERVDSVYINDSPFLLEEEKEYGGFRPRRSFSGFRYQRGGFSDHLPLVLRLKFKD